MQAIVNYEDLYALFDIMEIRGRYGDKVCAVTAKGKQYVRALGNMDALRVKTDPKFANSRGASIEFGAIAQLSATVRKAFGKMATDVSPQKLQHNKLTKKWVGGCKTLAGRKGQRTLPAACFAAQLAGFGWAKSNVEISKFGYATTTLEPLSLKPRLNYHLFKLKKYPNWATHIQPVCQIMALSDLKPDRFGKGYTPTHQGLHGATRFMAGTQLDLKANDLPNSAYFGYWHPDQLFPEAVEAGLSLVCVMGFELQHVKPDGTITERKYVSMQTVWAGKIATASPKNNSVLPDFELVRPKIGGELGRKPTKVAYNDRKMGELEYPDFTLNPRPPRLKTESVLPDKSKVMDG